MEHSDILDAGLGGLSAAVTLARRGHSVLVLESNTQLLSVGAGVALPPITRRWFESEGVLKFNGPECVSLDGINISRWNTGNLVIQTAANPLGKLNSIHHGDLQLALLNRARQLENIEVKLGTRVVDVNVEETAVCVATGERIVGDLIIAADGVKSTIKPKICPPGAQKAQPSGESAYRFLLPRHLLENDEELAALVKYPRARRWDGPDSHVVTYPVRNHELLNVVLIHPDDEYSKESWTSMTEKRHIFAGFQGWDPIIHKLVNLAPVEVPNFRMFLHPPSPIWVKGSTVLLGDACHAMLPYLGQGVAQAVEDSIAIATVLSVIERKDQLSVALHAYEISRRDRVEQIQAATYQARHHLHLQDGEAQEARDRERAAAAKAMSNSDVIKIQQFYWDWDAAQVAQEILSDLLK